MRAGTTHILWTMPEVAAATAGISTASFACSGVSIDSRAIRPGDLFIALKGPAHDGHEFVAAALTQGASAAIVHRLPTGLHDNAPLVRVEDTLQALVRLGRAGRKRALGRIAAITGSVGKTGTKEALRHVLSQQAVTSANEGSLNNHWGLPLSLARLPREAQFGVFEMGMNHPGEIEPLTRLARPHVAVVTTVQPVHSAFFKSAAEIADAKAEIFRGLEPGGIAVLNRDNRHFGRLERAARIAGAESILDFGRHAEAKVRLVDSTLGAEQSEVVADVAGEIVDYRLGIPGEHWVMNSLAVLAAVAALGAGIKKAAAALADLRPPKGRGLATSVRLADGAFTLVDESYNASPVSVTAALDTLGRRQPTSGGRRLAVLGDMLELGPESAARHVELARPIKRNRIDLVFTAGAFMEHLFEALPQSRRGGHAAGADRLLPMVLAAVRPGDIVMVKGSAGSRMGVVVKALAGLESGARRERQTAIGRRG